MRIVFMGTPAFAVPVLKYLVQNDYDVADVYTQPDRPAGRGCVTVSSPVKQAAESFNIEVIQPVSLKNERVLAGLAALSPDVIVVAAFGQILTEPVLNLPEYGCINIHPSLLPRYRGAVPVPAAILNGDEFTGVSIMLMDKGLDTGPVFTRAQIPVSASDNTGSLMEKLSLTGARLLLDVLASLERDGITPLLQDESSASYFGTLSRESGEIDWNDPSDVLWRKSFTRWQGRMLKIIEAEPVPGKEIGSTGQVAALDDGSPGVQTGDGVLRLLSLQAEGKKQMPAIDFLRGQRLFIGAILPC